MNALAELFKAILKSLLIGLGAWIFMAGMAVLTASGDGIPVNGMANAMQKVILPVTSLSSC